MQVLNGFNSDFDEICSVLLLSVVLFNVVLVVQVVLNRLKLRKDIDTNTV